MGKKKVVPKKGRPSLYKPEYDDLLIEHMRQGYSYETFAAIVDVCRDTLYQWEKDYPSFSYSKRRAKDKSQLYWEKLGLEGIRGELLSFSASAYIFTMKNRFQWIDEKNLKQDIKADVSAEVSTTNLEIQKYVDFLSAAINPKLNKGS